MKVYFDNAATTPIHPLVTKEIMDIIQNYSGNPSSIHAEGRKARAKIEQARKTIAQILNASIGEIFFTSSATEANNTIISNAVEHLQVRRIITTATEHPCVINTVHDVHRKHEIQVVLLNLDEAGFYNLEELQQHLEDDSAGKTLVSLMAGNNEIGTLHPISEIGNLCVKYNSYFHSDAVQVLGKFPLNVQDFPIHFLSGTAHKMHGPKGIGMMYINNENMIPPLFTGGAQERNMRAGTENVYGIAGFAKAFKLSVDGMAENRKKITALRQHMIDRLQNEFDDIEFNSPIDSDYLYHILSVSFPSDSKNEMLIYNLDIKGICASAGSACSSGTNVGSHVLHAIKPENPRHTIRFSFSHFNSIDEVDYVLDTLNEINI